MSTQLPAAGERPARVLRQGSAIVKANLSHGVAPACPESALAKGVEGVVQLNILVGLDGKIVKAIVVSGPQELAQSALAAISLWEYKPTLLNGKPVFIISTVSVTYRLQGGVII